MSRTYVVSAGTHSLFRGLVLDGHEFKDTSTPRPGGNVAILLSDEVAERLEEKRHPGETDNDLIERVLMTGGRGLN